jgi:hypothetical protein
MRLATTGPPFPELFPMGGYEVWRTRSSGYVLDVASADRNPSDTPDGGEASDRTEPYAADQQFGATAARDQEREAGSRGSDERAAVARDVEERRQGEETPRPGNKAPVTGGDI